MRIWVVKQVYSFGEQNVFRDFHFRVYFLNVHLQQPIFSLCLAQCCFILQIISHINETAILCHILYVCLLWYSLEIWDMASLLLSQSCKWMCSQILFRLRFLFFIFIFFAEPSEDNSANCKFCIICFKKQNRNIALIFLHTVNYFWKGKHFFVYSFKWCIFIPRFGLYRIMSAMDQFGLKCKWESAI